MNLRKVVPIIMATALIAAMLASSASAEIPGTLKTTKASWKNASGVAYATVQALKCSKAGASNIVLSGIVLGFTTELQATGVECIESKIENKTVEGVSMAEASGKLKFTGVSVLAPAGCVSPISITTNQLTLKVDHHYKSEVTTNNSWETTRPTTEGGTFANIPLTKCAAEGTYPVKGFATGTSVDATGVKGKNHKAVFNKETNEGGSLVLGTQPATITGEVNRELVSGEEFSVSE